MQLATDRQKACAFFSETPYPMRPLITPCSTRLPIAIVMLLFDSSPIPCQDDHKHHSHLSTTAPTAHPFFARFCFSSSFSDPDHDRHRCHFALVWMGLQLMNHSKLRETLLARIHGIPIDTRLNLLCKSLPKTHIVSQEKQINETRAAWPDTQWSLLLYLTYGYGLLPGLTAA